MQILIGRAGDLDQAARAADLAAAVNDGQRLHSAAGVEQNALSHCSGDRVVACRAVTTAIDGTVDQPAGDAASSQADSAADKRGTGDERCGAQIQPRTDDSRRDGTANQITDKPCNCCARHQVTLATARPQIASTK